MYRLSMNEEEMILRFSPKLKIGAKERQAVLSSIMAIIPDPSEFIKKNSSIIFCDQLGAVVIETEKLSSIVVTVSNIIPSSAWYMKPVTN